MPKKRFTVKLKNANPLFEEWLREWRDSAAETGSKLQYCYDKALQSLRKYPLPLTTGKDCIILQGFGEKLCKMLDEKLVQHQILNPMVVKPQQSCNPTRQDDDSGSSNVILHGSIKQREYIPTVNSGAWAILLTLYKKSLEAQYPGFMHKPEIIKHGQCLSEKSFVKPDPGGYYTAWSSMKTLLDKDLVTKTSSPAKYSLTDEGALLAYKLYRNNLQGGDLLSNDTQDNDTTKIASNSKNINKANKRKSKKGKSVDCNNIKTKSDGSSTQTSSSLSSETGMQEIRGESDSQSTCSNLSQEETFICLPNSFDIILLVDKMEVSGNRHPLDDPTLAELTSRSVPYEVRHLKVGDYTWICRDRTTNKELVLPYIVERKRMDDFGSSIKDGRFHEQKFRLKQCGIRNVIYLIESYGNNTHTGLPLPNLYQAATNTLIHDGFSVKFTDNTKSTMSYFAALTKILKNLYMGKTLVSCPKTNLSQAVNDDDLISLMTFSEFNRDASKNKNLKVQDIFVRMLLQLKGMSVDKALAIVEKYPTPQLLQLAYSEHTESIGEKLLASLECGSLRKKIGPCISQTVFQLFTKETY